MTNHKAHELVMAFDFGTSSIGVAIGQALTGKGQALKPLKAKDGIPNWKSLEDVIHEWQPAIVIVGKPLNMDGSESEMSLRANKFGKRLHGRFGLTVCNVDERLSTREAKQIAHQKGHSGNYKQQPVDSIAALLILESWFNQQQHGAEKY